MTFTPPDAASANASPPHQDRPAPPRDREIFIDALRESLQEGLFVRLTLGKYRGREPDLRRVQGRLATVGGEPRLSLVLRHAARDETRNLPLAVAAEQVGELLDAGFRHAHLVTATEDVQLTTNRRGEWRLQRGRAAAGPAPSLAHDREKQRYLSLERPFLAALGMTTSAHALVPAMARKWKQVNKFLEILDHALESAGLAGRGELRVLDFGAGKGYLTFAVHDYLTRVRGVRARVTGVELRPDLVRRCNEVARVVGADGLDFEAGSIRERMAAGDSADERAAQAVDVLIALHACDTATDEAMHLGVRAGAAVILCSPCCHKELRPQMAGPPALRPMLKFGIHLGQEAEMVTDSLRALLLEAEGYETQVFEFVSLEHTSKNKMILAVKRGAGTRRQALAQVRDIKAFYGIRGQRLEALLHSGAGVGGAQR